MTDSYVALYLSSAFKNSDPVPFLSLMLLFMGRLFPIIAMAPFLGAKVLPHSTKVVLGLSLFAIFFPQLSVVTATTLQFNMDLVLLMLKEMFVGSVIGFLISIPFMIVQSAGILIDHQRGGASLMVNDPTIQNQSSPLGTLFNLVFIFLFFRIDGPFIFFDIISDSYNALPPDQFVKTGFFDLTSAPVAYSMKILGHVMILSTQFAAPALIMILMTDFFLGIANRLAPQVQITFLGMPLKSLLGLTVVFFGWTLFNEETVKQAYIALKSLRLFTQNF